MSRAEKKHPFGHEVTRSSSRSSTVTHMRQLGHSVEYGLE